MKHKRHVHAAIFATVVDDRANFPTLQPFHAKIPFPESGDTHTVGRLATARRSCSSARISSMSHQPQAFGMLRDLGLKVLMPHRTLPGGPHRADGPGGGAYADPLADAMIKACARAAGTSASHLRTLDRPAGHRAHRRPGAGHHQPGTTIAAATRTPRPMARSGRSPSASAPPNPRRSRHPDDGARQLKVRASMSPARCVPGFTRRT